MARLDPAHIDFSLLAGAESLRPGAPRRISSTGSLSDSASATSASRSADLSAQSSSGSDDEEPTLQIGQLRALESFRQPQKVTQDANDWLWMHDEEPHRSRRKAILRAHPEVTKFMGYEPLTKYIVALVVTIQFTAAFLLRNTSPLSWKFMLVAYAVGGTANQNLFLAIHEITHNLAFKGIKANRIFAMFANLPIGIPYAMMFKKYHMEHHRALGVDGVDTDLPTRIELLCLKNVAGKAFFCTFQILFYALRPGFVRSQKLTRWHFFNLVCQFGFDFLVYRLAKMAGVESPSYIIWYFIMSSFFAGSLHPCAGHFIAEHYLFDQWDQETWSYYGCLNYLTYNVGYHNEHHDFPSIPWTRLPKLHAVANEYYRDLPQHTSWVLVTYRFIFESDVGLFSRVRRLPPKGKAELERVKGGGGMGHLGGLKDD